MQRVTRIVCAVAAGVLLLAAFGVFWNQWTNPATWSFNGMDIHGYMAATHRWLDTGTPYVASEVAGPFAYNGAESFLHPPVSLWLFAPFLVLPLQLWWALPIAATVWVVWSWHPAPWSWPLLAAALVWPTTQVALFTGNTDLWILAAVALGLRFGWPALLVVVKPSLIPLVFVGARRRSWWIGAAIVAALCLPFGVLWLDWLHVIQNSPADLGYSGRSYVFVLGIPLIAWLAQVTSRAAAGR